MKKLKTILWATDFHPSSKAAEQVAVDLAWRFDSQISLLHVVPPSGSVVSDDHRRVLGRKMLDETAKTLQKQRVVVEESTVVSGSAADRILRKAESINADLILLGAGGQMDGDRCRVGPTCLSVMEHARQPVMAVLPGSHLPTFRRILCPVDFSATSLRGLNNAIRLAKAFRGQLVVATVFPSSTWMDTLVAAGAGLDVDADVEQGWRTDFDTFISRVDFGEVPFVKDIRRGSPYEQISAMAKEHDCDVIVMGATGRSGLLRLLMGSVTRRVLQQLPCAILIVHDEDILLETVSEEELRNSRLLFAEANGLLEACHYEDALAKFDQVLARNPVHIEALEGRAVACEHLGQPERAARCRRRAEWMRRDWFAGMPAGDISGDRSDED